MNIERPKGKGNVLQNIFGTNVKDFLIDSIPIKDLSESEISIKFAVKLLSLVLFFCKLDSPETRKTLRFNDLDKK